MQLQYLCLRGYRGQAVQYVEAGCVVTMSSNVQVASRDLGCASLFFAEMATKTPSFNFLFLLFSTIYFSFCWEKNNENWNFLCGNLKCSILVM